MSTMMWEKTQRADTYGTRRSACGFILRCGVEGETGMIIYGSVVRDLVYFGIIGTRDWLLRLRD
jgi:hypothetical protein